MEHIITGRHYTERFRSLSADGLLLTVITNDIHGDGREDPSFDLQPGLEALDALHRDPLRKYLA